MTTEPPRPDQIQANVAAALSRLRGELAPTPPTGAAPQPAFDAAHKPDERDVDPVVTQAEPVFEAGSGLLAPDPTMALNQGKNLGDGGETPFARMTGINLADQPDLLAGIGTSPPPLADLPDPESEAAHRKRRLRNRLLAGGALVVALAIFWIVSGGGESGDEPVPIIAADSTPEKVKPADEGGLDVPNQDVAILNGENAATPSEGETVLPAPEQLATPPAVPEPAPAVAPSADTTATAADTGNGIPTVTAPAVDAIPSVPAPADPAASDTTSIIEPAPAVPATTSETQPAAADPAPAADVAPTADTAPAQTASAEPAASGGSARIQLAAVKTEAAAQKEWVRLQKAHPAALGALTLHVEKFAKSDSEVFYRIQAGPLQDKASAKQLCVELKQKNQACIVAN